MNTTVTSTLQFAIASFLLIVALAYSLWTMIEWPKAFEVVPSAATVYVQNTEIPEETVWTGSQVIAKLYRLSEEDIPIEIDGQLFLSDSSIQTIHRYVDIDAIYTKEFQIDSSGDLAQISLVKQ